MIKIITSFMAFLALNIFPYIGYAQTSTILPPEHIMEWNQAGIPGGIPFYEVGENVKDHGAVGNGSNDDTQAIRDAIAACLEGKAVYFPEGTYLVTSTISINKGIVLRGAGPSKTVIHSQFGDNPIRITSNVDQVAITTFAAQAMKGSSEFQVVSAQGISVGDFLYLNRTDGGPHMVEVEQVNGNQIVLTSGLASDFAVGSNVSRFPAVVVGAGVEDMKIFIDQPQYLEIRKVRIIRAARCWVKNIETAGLSHQVELDRCFQCEVRDNYFHNSAEEILQQTTFGSYGVFLSNGTNLCSVQNNVMHNHRHALITNSVIGGNVYGYNMSWGMWVHNQRNQSISDMCLHHNYGEAILIEGNTIELIRFDANPPGSKVQNVVLRNRPTLSGISGTEGTNINYLIGNEMPDKKFALGGSVNRITWQMENCVQHGNYVTYQNQGITWDSSLPQIIPNSYYLTEKPEWFGDLVWPPYGGDLMEAGNGQNPNRNPAEVRYWTIRFPENAPTLDTVEVNGTTAELSWSSNSVTGTTSEGTVDSIDFIIVRSTDGINFERIATTNLTTYTDTALTSGQQYWYYVRARNHVTIDEPGTSLTWSGPGGESEPSNSYSITVIEGTLANLALNKPVTVDSEYSPTYPAENAVDGDNISNASRWLSGGTSYPHYIEVNLGVTASITQVNFWTGFGGTYGYPVYNYQIQYWTGSAWADAVSVTGNSSAEVTHSFPPVTTDKVRLYCTNGQDNIVRLYEIEVWGILSGTVPTYTLTVNNGSGDGDYEEGAVVTITSDTPPAGQQFAAWTGDVSAVADVNDSSTTVTMPASAVTVTATYEAIPVLENVALNKPATCQSYSTGYPPEKANDADGTNSSYWRTNPYTESPWWKVDLGDNYDLSSVVVRNYVDGTRYYHYTVEASTDDVNYTQIAEKTNNDPAANEGETYTVNVTARYLKVTITYNSANIMVHISDFRAYGMLSSPTLKSSTSSIFSNNVLESDFGIYPNPAKDVLFFNLKENQAQTIFIYNSLGQLVMEEPYIDNSVRISELNEGIYFLVIKGISKNFHAKFIVK